jgi:hypothetical protein
MIAFIALLICAAGLLGSCAGSIEYLDFSKLSGDARVWECKEGNPYPKYWVMLPDIPGDRTTTVSFSVGGLPRSAYWFGLAAGEASSGTAIEAIKRSNVHCDVEIIGNPGGTVIRMWGPLEAESDVAGVRWHPNDTHSIEGVRRRIFRPDQMGIDQMFVPKPSIKYTIRIRVTTSVGDSGDPKGVAPTLTPVLWAGGERAGFLAWR